MGVPTGASAVPLPPMPAPLAYDSRAPEWVGGGHYASHSGGGGRGRADDLSRDFKYAVLPLTQAMAFAAEAGGIGIETETVDPAILDFAVAEAEKRRIERSAQLREERRGGSGAGDRFGRRGEREREGDDHASPAAAATPTSGAGGSAGAGATEGEGDGEGEATKDAAPSPTADTSSSATADDAAAGKTESDSSVGAPATEAAAPAPPATELSYEERRAAAIAAAASAAPYDTPEAVDLLVEFLQRNRGYRGPARLTLAFVDYLERARGVRNPLLTVFAMVRVSAKYRVAPLLRAFLSQLPDPQGLVNVPLPTKDSYLIHRATWEADPAVVRVLASFGAVTNRLNAYGEHPVVVIRSRFEQQSEPRRPPYAPFLFQQSFTPTITQQHVDAVTAVLQETVFMGAGQREPDAVLLASLKDAEQADVKEWLDTILRPKPAAAAAATAAAAGTEDAAAAAVEGEEAITQRHVFVTGIPFEYPMADVKQWFGACGTITRMHAFTNKGSFTAVREGKAAKDGEDAASAAAAAAAEAAASAKHTGECVIEFADAVCVAKALVYDSYRLLTRTIHVTLDRATPAQRRAWAAAERARRVAAEDDSLTASERTQHAAEVAKPIAAAKEEAAERRRLAKERQERKAAKAAAKAAAKKEKKMAASATEAVAAAAASASASAPASAAAATASTAGSVVPEWVTKPSPSAAEQVTVHISNLPFEADFETDVLPLLRQSGPVREWYVPTRALRSHNAFDQRILAQMPAGTTRIHTSTAAVLFAEPDAVRRAVIQLDGTEVKGRPMRVVRHKADAAKMTAEENRRAEIDGVPLAAPSGAGAGGRRAKTQGGGAAGKKPRSGAVGGAGAGAGGAGAGAVGKSFLSSLAPTTKTHKNTAIDAALVATHADRADDASGRVSKRPRRPAAGARGGVGPDGDVEVQLAAPKSEVVEAGEVVGAEDEFYL